MSESSSDNAGVRFPPPLVFLGFVLLGPLVDRALSIAPLALPHATRMSLAIAFIGLGLALILAAIRRFDAAKTRVEPWAPSTHFVAGGVYRFTRNPMYLGMAILSVGLAVALESVSALLLVILAIVAIDRFVVRREEAYLQRTFGREYDDYRRRVRRWI